MGKQKSIILIIGVIVLLSFVFIKLPVFFNFNSDIRNMDFENYYKKITKSIPNSQEAKVTDFYLLFNGKGEIERFLFRFNVPSSKKNLRYSVTYHPSLGLTTISHADLPPSVELGQYSGKKMFDALNHLDYKNILNRGGHFYTVLSTLDYKNREYNRIEPTQQIFAIENKKVNELKAPIHYPKSLELMLFENNQTLRRYLVK